MTTRTEVSRRAVLAGGAALAGVTALAGCGSSKTASVASSAASAGGATSPAATTSAPPASGTAARGTPTSGTAELAKLDDIPIGQAVSAKLPDGKPVVVARPSADTAVCHSAICTHQGCTVAPVGAELHCPCHGSVYNATTGAVLHGPAPRPLPAVPVTVRDGEVVLS